MDRSVFIQVRIAGSVIGVYSVQIQMVQVQRSLHPGRPHPHDLVENETSTTNNVSHSRSNRGLTNTK